MDTECGALTSIGFDVRRTTESIRKFWTSERRQKYLLRPKLELPLSVSKFSWPSRFHLASQYNVYNAPSDDDIVLADANFPVHFRLFGLWHDCEEMISHTCPTSHGDCGLAISVLIDDAYRSNTQNDEWLQAVTGTPIPPNDRRSRPISAGFDVATSDFLSAISSFCVNDYDNHFTTYWALKLNKYGLFDSASIAQEFCSAVTELFEDDSPFYVFSIGIMWDSSGVFFV